jgi:hypothetical protein
MRRMENIIFINAQQAQQIYCFKNIKEWLYNTNALIWYNKVHRQLQLTPDYISVKVNGSNRQYYTIQ